MFRLLFDPLSEIKAASEESYAKLLLYVLASAMFLTVGVLFFAWRFFSSIFSTSALTVGVFGTLTAALLFPFVMAFFFAVVYHVLDGKGGYYEALAATVLAMVAPSVAWFFAGALSFLPYGLAGSLLLLSYGYVLSGATGARAFKEYFKLDYAGVFLGAIIAKMPFLLLVAGWFILL